MSATAPDFPSLDDVAGVIRERIAGAKKIACLAHRDADADSLGSALGFALSLRAAGRDAVALVPSPVPFLLEYLPGYDTIVTEGEGVDLLFTFDCATVGRFGDKAELVRGAPHVVNVDHHVSNEGFGDVQLIDVHASATGQVVYALIEELELPMTADVATNLYAALFTDTGGFRHENTTEEALRLGADLVAHGADAPWVALKSYKSRSVSQMRLEALSLSRLRAELDGRLIWSEVTQEMLREASADMQESEGIIDQLQSVAPMKIAILFKENSESATKVSVRTRDEFDATSLCTPFGGGGHRRAAGCDLALPLAEAREKVLALARSQLTAGSVGEASAAR